MPITNKEKWEKYVTKNDDPYGKACVDVGRKVMELLDEREEYEPDELISEASKAIEEEGLTGFMAGMISLMVTQCHSKGEEWKKKWNKSYGDEDRKGVINPAIITIGDKKVNK